MKNNKLMCKKKMNLVLLKKKNQRKILTKYSIKNKNRKNNKSTKINKNKIKIKN